MCPLGPGGSLFFLPGRQSPLSFRPSSRLIAAPVRGIASGPSLASAPIPAPILRFLFHRRRGTHLSGWWIVLYDDDGSKSKPDGPYESEAMAEYLQRPDVDRNTGKRIESPIVLRKSIKDIQTTVRYPKDQEDLQRFGIDVWSCVADDWSERFPIAGYIFTWCG